MEFYIFSPCGYAKCAKKVFGDDFLGCGLTKKHYDMLLSDVSEGAKRHVGEITSTLDCANDVVLIDGKMLTLALPYMAGLVTLKLIEISGAEWTQHKRGVSNVLPRATKQRSHSAGRTASPLSVASDVSVPFTELRLATPSFGGSAPMTSIVTCRPKVKCWPGASRYLVDNVKDTDLFKFFREAVVVSLNTMRLLGAEEGSLVQLEYHCEEEVKVAEAVVFGLLSESVGEELSSDSYLRHFIAPLFLDNIRAVSVGEEFELKNYRHGQVHVTVIAIDDGKLKCGFVTDATRIRLVVQPAAPPTLQGHECSNVFKDPARQRSHSFSNRKHCLVGEYNLLRNTSLNVTQVSPRSSSLFRMGKFTSRVISPNVRGSPHVFGSLPRRSSRSAEPHSIETCLTYTPQTLDNVRVQALGSENPLAFFNVFEDTKKEASLRSNAVVSQDAGAKVECCRHLVSTMGKCNGVRAPSIYCSQHHCSCCPYEEGFFEEIENKKSAKNSVRCAAFSVDKAMVNKLNSFLSQDDKSLSCTLTQQDDKQNGDESNHSLKEKPCSVHSVLPETVKCPGISLATPPPGVKADKIQSGITLLEKLATATSSEIRSDVCSLRGGLRVSEVSQEESFCDVLHESAKASIGDVVNVALQKEKEATGGVFYAENTAKSIKLLSGVDLPLEPQFFLNSEVYTQCRSQSDVYSVSTQKDNNVAQDVFATESVSEVSKNINNEAEELSNVVSQNNGKKIENLSCPSTSFKVPHASSALKETADHQQHLARIAEKASEIIQRWLEVKARWQHMPISSLLKCKPYIMIKQFQHFIALYKELRQRHLDCLAYLDSPYGHTLRGGMVVRISLFEALKDEVGGVSTEANLQRFSGVNDVLSVTFSDESDEVDYMDSWSVADDWAAELLKLRLRTVSAALGHEILHIFRVWGTRPALYCTLMRPYTNGSCEVVLMGKTCRVDVLRTTIMEDLCDAREVTRCEWTELATQWSEALQSVLQLGVFTEHLKNVRQLLFELSSTLHHVGGVRQCARRQRSVTDSHSFSGDDSALRGWKKKKKKQENVYLPTDTFDINQTALFFSEDVTTSFTQRKSFFFYLQELQDTYYLYSELFEPFVVYLKQQVDVVSGVTNAMQCKELFSFLQVSYQAQLADEESKKGENKDDGTTHIGLVAAEKERAAFIALVEAHKAGKQMPLPEDWWGKA